MHFHEDDVFVLDMFGAALYPGDEPAKVGTDLNRVARQCHPDRDVAMVSLAACHTSLSDCWLNLHRPP